MTLGQKCHFIIIINKKSHVFFMPMFLVQMNIPFNQCENILIKLDILKAMIFCND